MGFQVLIRHGELERGAADERGGEQGDVARGAGERAGEGQCVAIVGAVAGNGGEVLGSHEGQAREVGAEVRCIWLGLEGVEERNPVGGVVEPVLPAAVEGVFERRGEAPQVTALGGS